MRPRRTRQAWDTAALAHLVALALLAVPLAATTAGTPTDGTPPAHLAHDGGHS